MCEPTTMLMIASTVIGGVGAVSSGIAASNAAEYNAQVGEQNAQLAEFSARDAVMRGNEEERKQRMRTSQMMSRQTVAQAANGLDTAYGSALDVATDTAAMGEMDALTIRSNTYREAYDYRVQAHNARTGATLQRMEGRSRKTAGYLSAFGQTISGGADAYKTYKNNTGFGG